MPGAQSRNIMRKCRVIISQRIVISDSSRSLSKLVAMSNRPKPNLASTNVAICAGVAERHRPKSAITNTASKASLSTCSDSMPRSLRKGGSGDQVYVVDVKLAQPTAGEGGKDLQVAGEGEADGKRRPFHGIAGEEGEADGEDAHQQAQTIQ